MKVRNVVFLVTGIGLSIGAVFVKSLHYEASALGDWPTLHAVEFRSGLLECVFIVGNLLCLFVVGSFIITKLKEFRSGPHDRDHERMLSRRTDQLWVGACLAPISMWTGMFLAWVHESQDEVAPGVFIDRSLPGYFEILRYAFYLGGMVGVFALISTAIDYAKSKRGNIVRSSQNN